MTKATQFHRCWDEAAIKRYFTTEAMAKDKEAFMEVHLSINQIIVDKEYNAFNELGGQEYTDEIGLKNLIIKSHPTQANRVFSLIGETGSGKSELCQWLHYQIQDEVHIPILIRRSMIRLSEIVLEINRHLAEPMPDEMKDITDLWEESVSKQLVAAMLLHVQRPEVLNQITHRDADGLRHLVDTPKFEMRMRQNFVDYCKDVKDLGKVRELNLLPEAHFRDLVVEAEGLKNPALCYRELQRAITDCLATTLRVDDLIDKLRRVSAAFKKSGQRPVLLIEDITTFGFLQNDLLDFLFDLSSGNFDVVIGITTGFEKANEQQIYKAQQTIRERIEGRFVLSDENNETLFLREQYTALAELYLKAVKYPGCSMCADDNCQQAFGLNLYPYNQQFLENVYKGLTQDGQPKQTPRLYLRALSHTLQTQVMAPFESIEILIVQPPTAWFAQSPAYGPDLEKLLKWYGLNTNKGVFLAQQIAEAFHVTVPPNIEVTNGCYQFKVRPGGEKLPPPSFIISKPQVSITSVEPRAGLINLPNTIQIKGTNFQPGCTAHLGRQILQVTHLNVSYLQATTPIDLPPGLHDLTVTNPNGTSGIYANAYAVKEPESLSITKIQPSESDADQPADIYIQGDNFQRGCTVHLGQTAINSVYSGSTQLKATVPANHPAGMHDLTVLNPDGKNVTLFQVYTIRPTDLFRQLDEWLERKGKFSGRARFKEGIWKLLDMFQFNPFTLQHPDSIARNGAPLVYTRGDRESQIYLHDSADSLQPGYLKLTIHPQREWRDLYSQILTLGLGDYKVDDTRQLNHALLYDWLTGRVDTLRQEMCTGLTSALNMPLERFIVISKFLLLNNLTGLYEFTPETLARPLIQAEPFRMPIMGDRPEKLANWAKAIQSLFVAFFHFRESVVNYPYLSAVMAECDPLKALADLKTNDSKNVYEAYTVGPSKEQYPLRGLANLISLYARDLLALQHSRQLTMSPSPEDLAFVADLCGSATDIQPEKLRTQLDQLRQLSVKVGITWERRWDLSLLPLDRTKPNLDFPALAETLSRLPDRIDQFQSASNVFIFISLQREVEMVIHQEEYEILWAIHKISQTVARFLVVRSTDEDDLKGDVRYKAFQEIMNLYLELSSK